MKYLLSIFIILLFNNYIAAQECVNDITALIYSPGFPYGRISETENSNYDDSRIIKWNINKAVYGEPIYLGTIDTYNYVPFELLDEVDQVENLQTSMINQWNNIYGLQMGINDQMENIYIGFSDDLEWFESVGGTIASAGTIVPVEEDPLDGYKFYEYSNNSLVGDGNGYRLYNGVVLFNSSDDKGFEWTSSSSPQFGSHLIGTVMLHELGHVLSMGHSIPILGEPRIMDIYYNPSQMTPYLTDCDKANAAYHSEKIYEIVTSINEHTNSIAITSSPAFMDENQNYTLTATFYRGEANPTDHVLEWNWKIYLHHENGLSNIITK